MGKIIAITNQKGGVGKTTTTINLGSALGFLGKKVLIIDIDAQGNATQGLGLDKVEIESKHMSTLDLMLNYTKDPNKYILKTDYENVSCIGASQSLITFEIHYQGRLKRELVLKHALNQVREDYDYILIDCPPSLNSITLNGMSAADSVLIPVQSEFYALEGMTQLLNTINVCKKQLNRDLTIEGILMTMYITNSNLSANVLSEVKRYFSSHLYKTVIRRSVALAEAPSYGMPIIYYDKRSNGSIDYMSLASEVIDNGKKKRTR